MPRPKNSTLATATSVGLLIGVIGMFAVAGYAVAFAKMWSGLPTISVLFSVAALIVFCWWEKAKKRWHDRSVQFHAKAACLGILSLPLYVLVILIFYWIGWIEIRGW